jgi:hypothetical protein
MAKTAGPAFAVACFSGYGGSRACCTAATTTTLDSAGDVGRYTSVIVGTDGFGLISYYDDTKLIRLGLGCGR